MGIYIFFSRETCHHVLVANQSKKQIIKISRAVFIPNCTLSAKAFEVNCIGSFAKSIVQPFYWRSLTSNGMLINNMALI